MSRKLVSRIASLVVATSFLFTLAACGTKSGTDSAATASTKAAGTTATAAVDYTKMEPMKVSAMLLSYGSIPEPESVIEKEFEKRTNSALDITWIPYAEYTNRFNLQLASGDIKDVSQSKSVNGDSFYPQVIQAIKGGAFQDLDSVLKNTDYLKKNEIMKNWSADVWKNVSFNGKIYAMPRTMNPSASNSGLIVRKDLMDKAGLKEPTTLDELSDFIIKLTKPGEYYGLQFSTDDFDANDSKPIAVAYTGVQDWGVDKDGNFFFQSFMPEYKDYLKWMKKLYDAKAIDPEFALKQSDNSNFTKGKSAMKMHVWWNSDQSEDRVTKKYFDKAVMDKNPEAQTWNLMPIKGTKGYTVGRTTGFDSPIFISSKVAKKDLPRLMDILNHTEEDYQNFLVNGIEGVHYAKAADGTMSRTDEMNKNRTRDYSGGWYMMFLLKDQTPIQTKYVEFKASAALTKRVTEVAEASEKYLKEMNLTLPQLTLDAPTYQSKWTTVTKDLKDNRVKFVMGKMSVEEWDKYVKDVTASETYQAILKEFKAAYAASK